MNSLRFLLSAGLILLLTGCVGFWQSNHHESSSVLQFLYPGKDQPFVQPSIPTLRLPLRVGVAFVPPAGNPGNYRTSGDTFSEAQKIALLQDVVAKFRALPFVQSIEPVPTSYLRPGGGFANLDQLHALLGVDVIVLLSYDQLQNTGDSAWSLAYWTIVGAYVIPAQKNDTHTLMEAAVYDITSRSLLFRAPGVSALKGHSTLVGNPADLRADSALGYAQAARDLTINLQQELEAFKVRARSEPEKIHIEHQSGYTGGGALDGWFAALLGLLLAGRFAISRR